METLALLTDQQRGKLFLDNQTLAARHFGHR